MAYRDPENRQIVKAAMAAPYLERDEERQLAVEWRDQRSQAALDRLTRSHMRLVISMASKFRAFGLPLADLIQEGHVGLLEAAARFEPDREVRFSTYASWWIRAAIQDYVLRNWSIVRGGTSSAQKALFFNLRRLRARILKTGATVADDEVHRQIGLAIGVSTADVSRMASRLSAPDTSLNSPVSDADESSAERQDFLVCTRPLPDELVERSVDETRRLEWLRSAMDVLSSRELQVLRERRLSEDGETLESLGVRLGISKERVRQIESRAMEKLKSALVKAHPEIAPSP
ncbi:RNA polymerase factor sigma-32 [Methylobrevis albus]|uniref:RNA polymerase factor sigma-32 n=1 Tax=Methylobrevis albus TaxID=2793297 RepID=A0A931MWL2_9HYPH|nr:RNA polymerase factor sigma-32 [Methylobrevis albus]MBH0237293.1 RNA polymerase factor sigma-32 [Methylobrevis albus]